MHGKQLTVLRLLGKTMGFYKTHFLIGYIIKVEETFDTWKSLSSHIPSSMTLGWHFFLQRNEVSSKPCIYSVHDEVLEKPQGNAE